MTDDAWLLDPRALAADLARGAFLLPGGHEPPRSVGAEVEFLLLDADRLSALPIHPSPETGAAGSLSFLRRFGRGRGWEEEASQKGAPSFRLPGGLALSYEPGGQIEIRTPPDRSASRLLSGLRAVTAPLIAEAAAEGIVVLGAGIDPRTPLEEVPLQVSSHRYALMDRYLRSIGPWGARMMRQTAAVQLNVDFGAAPLEDWRLANALAPFLTALFANSPRYAGQDAGARSTRALAWRRLDPSRTGIFRGAGEPRSPGEYAAFGLGAGAIFAPAEDGHYPSFAEWLARGGVVEADWRGHLTTLFPEVRPKGYLEVRSIDALPPQWLPAALAVIWGLFLDPEAARDAAALAGPPDPALLEPAARDGMAHAEIGPRAAALYELALEGCVRLGEEVFGGPELEAARAYAACYAAQGRSPADDGPG